MKGHTFVTAHFSNNERTLVEVVWEKDGKNVLQYVEADDNSAAWKTLLSHIDVDGLHEKTYKNIRETQKAFEQTAIRIAKDQGILRDFQDKTVINDIVMEMLFNKDDTSESKNTLFVFKLKLFEQDFVKNCKNRKLKSSLRKSENIREAIKTAIEIFEKS